MTHTRTYTRQELALKRMCDGEPIKNNGVLYDVTAIIRVNGSYFLRLDEHEPSHPAIRKPRTVPLEAVSF